MGYRSFVAQDRRPGNTFTPNGQKELRSRNRQMIVAADVRRLKLKDEGRMLNEETSV
jgi:hypothetical protein